jgi:hypothetical protein
MSASGAKRSALALENGEGELANQAEQNEIANLAYAIWQQRGCPEGSAEQDWDEAEREVREKQAR